MGTSLKKHKNLIFAAALVACQPNKQSSSSHCSDVQAAIYDDSAILKMQPVVPAGGFIHVGPRSCTATFLLEKVRDSSLELTAFTAHHCFRENSASAEDVSISVHIPSGSGYLKNLKATDDFTLRKSEFVAEVQKLGSVAATAMARSAVEIPLFAERGLESLSPDSTSVENDSTASDDYQRNVCISSKTDRLSVPDSQEVCWSTFDSTVRTLTLRADQIGPAAFKKLLAHMEQKRRAHDELLSASPKIASYYDLWNNNLRGQVGAWRLLNYTKITSFLNKEVCSKYLAKDDPNQSACANREKLTELVGKFLVETDIDGKKKSIIEQASGLGFSLDSPFLRALPGTSTMMQITDLFQQAASDQFYKFINQRVSSLRDLFPLKNQKIMALPKQFSIAANPIISGHADNLAFALIDSGALLPNDEPIPSFGVRSLGILRMYLAKKSAKVSFGLTDSGAMFTFAGVVPLLVLNTVDDKPTSGGTAILALPELMNEDDSVEKGRYTGSRTSKTNAQNTNDMRVESTKVLVADSTISCR